MRKIRRKPLVVKRGRKLMGTRIRLLKALPIVVPDRYMCRLRYCDVTVLDGDATSAASQAYRANDLYDPDSTGIGHQPKGFDQLCLMYGKFTVLGSKISVQPISLTNASISPYGVWGIGTSFTGTAFSGKTLGSIMESENNVAHARYAGNTNHTSMVGPVSQFRAVRYFSGRKFFNEPMNGSEYSCDSSHPPANVAYFEVWCVGDGTSNPGSLQFLVQIEYIVRCSAPLFLVQS